jgi:thiosulfate dehydrogenase (quinone) large subunit
MTADTAGTARVGIDPLTAARGLAALRIFVGVVWLTNGLAKLFDKGAVDLGVVSFGLISRSTARNLLVGYTGDKSNAPGFLKSFYGEVILPNWDFFGWFLTAAELAAGTLLVLGVASRLGALVPLLLIGPLWVMNLDNGRYLFEWPLDIVPLVILALVPAGRAWGGDARLAARYGSRRFGRWPF